MTNHNLSVTESPGKHGWRLKIVTEPMRLETMVFGLCRERYGNLNEMAQAMGISISHVYRVRQGNRHINEKFIIGAVRAFPGYKLNDLFRVVLSGRHYDRRQ